MTEFRAQINMRASTDLNMSFSFTHFPDDESQAESDGQRDARLVSAYAKGYAASCEQMLEETE